MRGKAVREQDDPAWARFREWLRSNKFPVNKLTLGVFEDTGRGLISTKDIEPNEVVVEVPKRLLITIETVDKEFLGQLKSHGWPLSEHAALALFLARHRFLESSPWAPYMGVVPSNFDTVAGNFPKELFDLLPWHVREISMKQREKVDVDFGLACRFLESVKEPLVEREDFMWGWYAVNTRCVSLHTEVPQNVSLPKGESTIALAPFLDLLNHSLEAKISPGYDTVSQSFKITTLVGYAKGHECFISYGPHDNGFLLAEYGFAIGSVDNIVNMYDFVSLDREVESMTIPGEKPGFRDRIKKELAGAGLLGSVYILKKNASR
ncbi:SET domain-containing protein 4 [Blyttiomyces sp. JEL0837]|nr:SET domain-containing protein 4 [Blyttiomyces sp. JEL0837]